MSVLGAMGCHLITGGSLGSSNQPPDGHAFSSLDHDGKTSGGRGASASGDKADEAKVVSACEAADGATATATALGIVKSKPRRPEQASTRWVKVVTSPFAESSVSDRGTWCLPVPSHAL
eukprot:CAMPEP_0115070898 /NCGR_PEP_ID=MMETSP0227-20121206/13375_1 /TAXON_ID=89957 /ORGANISM="Polarella glacialis, Strain CCMP 1383" /LENGTH=118 /DNA_ID=CAMNT_0002457475 /DNA_START=699 /DNA_END=1055 /DNA_ORIENTATION=-